MIDGNMKPFRMNMNLELINYIIDFVFNIQLGTVGGDGQLSMFHFLVNSC